MSRPRWCPACGKGPDCPPLGNDSACRDCAGRRSAEIRRRSELWQAAPQAEPLPDFATATLHTGFLCIVETPEQMAALRDEKPKAGPGPATSGVPRAMYELRPIDRVAARVVQG